MEQKIKDCFDSLCMSEELSRQIEGSLKAPQKKARWAPVAAAACAALVLVAACTPARALVADAVERIVTSIMGPGHNVSEQLEFFDGDLVEERGTTPDGTAYTAGTSTMNFPSWLEAGEDGLRFTANGEDLDLTGMIGDTQPFTYVYTENGFTYYLAVGGSYDPLLREDITQGRKTGTVFGWCAFVSRETENGIEWLTGHSRGYCDDDGNEYPWFTAAKELLGVPW